MLVVVGLNRTLATVEDREALSLAEEEIGQALAGWGALDGVDEVAVVSTRHRVEIYANARWPGVAGAALRSALGALAGRQIPLFELHGQDAFRHLVRVSSSLESVTLGEPRIQGQVEDAFARAAASGAAGTELAGALARALAAARRVQTETAIGRSGVSWGGAAACLAGKVLGELRGRRVVILGGGELARLSALHLAAQGTVVTVLDRTVARAEALAAEVGGTAGGLDALAAALDGAEVVVSAARPAPSALEPAAVARLMARRRRPLVVVDLAVPCAIPGATGAVEGVYLCDVDDLDRIRRAWQAEGPAAVAEAGRIVDAEVERYAHPEAERRAVPVRREARSRARAIVARLLHAPGSRLEPGVHRAGGEEVVGAAVGLLELRPDARGGGAGR